MKKILFVLSALTLLSYGCNRNEDKMEDRGMQEEQTRPMSDSMDLESEQIDRPGQTPGFEKEEYRDSNVTTPVDERPELEEQEEMIEDQEVLEDEMQN